MNICQQLFKKNSHANADTVLNYVTNSPESVVKLMACFLSNEVIVAQRAAQVVGDLCRQNPASLKPWWEEMLRSGRQPVHDAIRRNLARYYSELTLTLPLELEQSLVQLLTS